MFAKPAQVDVRGEFQQLCGQFRWGERDVAGRPLLVVEKQF
jgi:hypothetical protein